MYNYISIITCIIFLNLISGCNKQKMTTKTMQKETACVNKVPVKSSASTENPTPTIVQTKSKSLCPLRIQHKEYDQLLTKKSSDYETWKEKNGTNSNSKEYLVNGPKNLPTYMKAQDPYEFSLKKNKVSVSGFLVNNQ